MRGVITAFSVTVVEILYRKMGFIALVRGQNCHTESLESGAISPLMEKIARATPHAAWPARRNSGQSEPSTPDRLLAGASATRHGRTVASRRVDGGKWSERREKWDPVAGKVYRAPGEGRTGERQAIVLPNSASARTTSENTNRAPPASLSSTEIDQPWASAILSTIARPKPVPSSPVE